MKNKNRSPYTIVTNDYTRINIGLTGDDWEPGLAEKFFAQVGTDGLYHFGSTKREALLLLLDYMDENLVPKKFK